MAFEERSISGNITSDANFRTWGSTVSDLMQDVGLTQTADTGQINWSTVVRPAINSFAGYEVFTLDTDTEFSNFGLYIRIDYGVGANTSLQRLGIQIGESTDGAGTLTGKVGTQRIFAANPTNTTTTHTYYCSSGDGYFAFAGAWVDGGSSNTQLFNQIFIIERLRDNTGAPTADGIYTLFSGMNGTPYVGYSQIVRPDDINPAYSPSTLRLGTYVPNMSGNRGTDLYLFTHQPADYAIYNPCLSSLFYYYTDLTTNINFTVDMYGTTRTFKPIGRNFTSGTFNTAFGHTNSGLALLWE